MSSRRIRFYGRAIWNFIGSTGFKVGVVDYPMLYPAYSVNGFMVSSWGSDVTFYPSDLLDRISCNLDKYDIFVNCHLDKYNNLDFLGSDIDKAVEKELKLLKYLTKE